MPQLMPQQALALLPQQARLPQPQLQLLVSVSSVQRSEALAAAVPTDSGGIVWMMNLNEHGVEEHLRRKTAPGIPFDSGKDPKKELCWLGVYFNPSTRQFPPTQDWNDGTQSVWDQDLMTEAELCLTGLATLRSLQCSVAQPSWDLEIAVFEAFCTKVKSGILCHGPLLGWAYFCGDEFRDAWCMVGINKMH